jgi:hypothetical protein
VRALGTVTDVPTAGQILGIGRNKAYQLVRSQSFPVPILKIGRRYVVPVQGLLRVLGMTATAYSAYPAAARTAATNAHAAMSPIPPPLLMRTSRSSQANVKREPMCAGLLRPGATWPHRGGVANTDAPFELADATPGWAATP